MTLGVGEPAPDFTLRDQHGRPRSLASACAERAVALVFFPFAFTGVCAGELRALRDDADRIDRAGAEVLAISCDPMFALRVMADQDRLEMPLLSDFWPHGQVAAAYGVLDTERGCPTRSTFVLDRDGIVRWSIHNAMGEARSVDDLVRELEELETAGEGAK
jgi:mycoredoxin-dependent peroxiredoxin